MVRTIELNGSIHILTEGQNRPGHPNANFAGTGMALCGVARKGETFDKYVKRNKKWLLRKGIDFGK